LSSFLFRRAVFVACSALLAAILLSGCSPASPSSEVESGAREVVTFEGGEVTEGEVVEGVERANAAQAAQMGGPAPEVEPGSPEFEAAKAQVVPQLLTVDLARAYARENDIRVSEEDVRAEVDAAREQVAQQAAQQAQAAGQEPPNPEEAFQQALEQFGFTEESFREEVRTGLLVQSVQEEAVGDVGPTEEEVRNYYDENREAQFTNPETRCIRHILFASGGAPGETTGSSAEQEAATEEARAEAEDVKRQIEDGGDFAELARENSDDPGSGEQGGDLGCNPSGGFVPEFDEAAFGAEEGELLGPVETEFGFHLIEVTEIRPPGETPFEEVRPQIEEQLSGEQQATEFDAWIQDQLERRNVKYLPGYDPAQAAPPEAPGAEAPPEGGEEAPAEEAPPEGEGQ
jgi:peptidyl-prolyl cis-trans isomerase C